MRPEGARDPIAGPDNGPETPFPLRFSGEVIRGFGRGSKELGIPTANVPLEGLKIGGEELDSGIYFGWCSIHLPTDAESKDSTAKRNPDAAADESCLPSQIPVTIPHVYPMVMSVGWNPYYKNTVRSVEVHILHKFDADFYGHQLRIVVLGLIRPEYDYESLEGLIDDINTDIDVTRRSLERTAYSEYRGDEYLSK